MLAKIKARRENEEGFTLIELMVVVLIIAILIAIAIPTFLGARQRAQDRAAQSSARNGLTAAKTVFTDRDSYMVTDLATTIAALQGVEPSLTFGTASTDGPNTLDVDVTAVGDAISLTVKSRSGDCFTIMDIAQGANAGTYFTSAAAAGTPAVCATPAASSAAPGAGYTQDGW